MTGETLEVCATPQQESLSDRCARLIPGYLGCGASALIADEGALRDLTPNEASYFARHLALSVIEGTAPFGTVDPQSDHGRELAAFAAEFTPAADAAEARWAARASA